MPTKITLYIGADNKTRQIDTKYIEIIGEILSKYWKNFTLTKHVGYYEGQVEESLSAVIIVLRLVLGELDTCIKELKVKLVQESIGCEVEANVDFKLR